MGHKIILIHGENYIIFLTLLADICSCCLRLFQPSESGAGPSCSDWMDAGPDLHIHDSLNTNWRKDELTHE